MSEIQRDLTIVNRLGLHARAAARFVSLASGFEAEIRLSRNNREVNAKSIMGVMMLAAGLGTQVHLEACGPDAEEAVERLAELVANRFGEHE